VHDFEICEDFGTQNTIAIPSKSIAFQMPPHPNKLLVDFAIAASSFIGLFLLLVLIFFWQIAWTAPPKKKRRRNGAHLLEQSLTDEDGFSYTAGDVPRRGNE
jgi:hypothetical protein